MARSIITSCHLLTHNAKNYQPPPISSSRGTFECGHELCRTLRGDHGGLFGDAAQLARQDTASGLGLFPVPVHCKLRHCLCGVRLPDDAYDGDVALDTVQLDHGAEGVFVVDTTIFFWNLSALVLRSSPRLMRASVFMSALVVPDKGMTAN